MQTSTLLSSIQFGWYTLPNRIVIVLKNCLSSAKNGIPSPNSAIKYAERTEAGLIITEPTTVFPLSEEYQNYPGIHSLEQLRAWRQITEAVHEKGGKIFLQLWYCGSMARSHLREGKQSILPKAIVLETETYPSEKIVLPSVSSTLTAEKISEVVRQFRRGAQNALAAEFDGVEIYGEFGYLIDELVGNSSNQHNNNYAEDVENRTQLLLAIIEAVANVWDEERVGVKVSPSHQFLGFRDPDPEGTFYYLLDALNFYNLAYVRLVEPNEADLVVRDIPHSLVRLFRPVYRKTIMLEGKDDLEKANAFVEDGDADLVFFDNKLFVDNPDLLQRLLGKTPTNK